MPASAHLPSRTQPFMIPIMKRLTCLKAILTAILLASGSHLPAAEWLALFNGSDLAGWKQINGTAKYEVHDGTIRGWTAKDSPILNPPSLLQKLAAAERGKARNVAR